MKKTICLFLTLILALTFVACESQIQNSSELDKKSSDSFFNDNAQELSDESKISYNETKDYDSESNSNNELSDNSIKQPSSQKSAHSNSYSSITTSGDNSSKNNKSDSNNSIGITSSKSSNSTPPTLLKVETILFDKVVSSVLVGDSELIGVTIYPSGAVNKTLVWSSSNTNIATVDASGNVKTTGIGTVVISAKTTDGSVKSPDYYLDVKANPIKSCKNLPLHLYSNDGKVYLGKLVTNKYDADSIWNEYGTYGSKYQTNSIWNEYGKYGSKYQSESAFNPYSSKPPVIVDNSGNKIAFLTANESWQNGYTITQLERALKQIGQ